MSFTCMEIEGNAMKSFLIIIGVLLTEILSLNASFGPWSRHKPMSSTGYQLLMAAKHGDLEQVKCLVHARGINVNEQDRDTGEFPLLLAVFRDHPDVVRVLLEAPFINPAQCDFGNHTAYWWADACGNTTITRMMTIDRRKLAIATALHPRCGADSAVRFLKTIPEMLKYIWELQT